jgi:hypothetical protein
MSGTVGAKIERGALSQKSSKMTFLSRQQVIMVSGQDG